MLPIINFARQSVHKHGLKEFIARCYTYGFDRAQRYNALFDIKHNIKTKMIIPLDDLDFNDPEVKQKANKYEPSSAFGLMNALKALRRYAGNLENLGFVDIGCGAGRAMFVAAEAGIKNITGVEYSPKLVRMCQENIKNYLHKHKYADLNVIELDAAQYLPPHNISIFFFAVPFKPEIYNKVIENIITSVNKHPRTVYVLDYPWSKFDFSKKNFQLIFGKKAQDKNIFKQGINIYKLTPLAN